MSERNENGEVQFTKVPLRPLTQKDFPTSAAFVEAFGHAITAKGMFLPLPKPLPVGQEVTLRFTLRGEKEIIAGVGKVVFVRDGKDGRPAGCGIRFLELTPRSRKNLQMILDWRRRNRDESVA